MSDIDAAAVLDAVANWLKQEAMPELQGATGFNARVAVNALKLAKRELVFATDARARELDRLKALLNRDGDLQMLRALLAGGIASGAIGIDDRDLLRHLRITVIDQLAVDQPNYSAYLRVTQHGGDVSEPG